MTNNGSVVMDVLHYTTALEEKLWYLSEFSVVKKQRGGM